MLRSGTLTRWNADRGFGFISPTTKGPDIFVHISAFPRDGIQPVIGERLTFELGRDKTGRSCAVGVLRPGATERTIKRVRPTRSARPASSGWGGAVRLMAVLLIAGSLAHQYVQRQRSVSLAPVESPRPLASIRPAETPSNFRCDGRQRCGQMHSCAEARWFLQHCPNTQMDGDSDGEPCEDQWCN